VWSEDRPEPEGMQNMTDIRLKVTLAEHFSVEEVNGIDG